MLCKQSRVFSDYRRGWNAFQDGIALYNIFLPFLELLKTPSDEDESRSSNEESLNLSHEDLSTETNKRYRFLLNPSNFHLTLLEDVRGEEKPFVRVHLGEWFLFLEGLDSLKRMKGTLTVPHISTDYFNHLLNVWEPVIEPWSLSVEVCGRIEV